MLTDDASVSLPLYYSAYWVNNNIQKYSKIGTSTLVSMHEYALVFKYGSGEKTATKERGSPR